MHKQVSSLLADGGSPGQLARYTQLLASRKVNIRAIGGAEWNHHGAVAVLVDDRTDEDELAEWLTGQDFPSVPIFAAEAVLPDVPGSLANAATRLGDLNILTILVADTHGGVGLVSFGFGSSEEADQARDLLGDLAVPVHGLTAAWNAHEVWDGTNPNPQPDPHNP